jgi:phospholipase/carboxylesterase
MDTPLAFVHRFEPAARAGAPTLLLLHGTGGNESDLIPLGRVLAPGAALLSPRGKVLEHGMPRFFRRLAEGVFDEEDVRRRALELAAFIGEARSRYGLAALVAVGYSNGANIAAAMLFVASDALAGAVLLRAMVPLSTRPEADLAGRPVLILSGTMDPIAVPDNAARLASALADAGARVAHRTLPAGHQLSQGDVDVAREWLAALEADAAALSRF